MFRFKQFSIDDSNCGMKIGVDGVLLGAWIQHDSPKRILDVGTGSGLIALMMAQKFPQAIIHAIELEDHAIEQATKNFKNSPFSNEFNVIHCDYLKRDEISNKSGFEKNTTKFDIIVSNLPYFDDGGEFKNHKRDLARSSKHLPLNDFLKKSERLLSNQGAVYFIYPNNDTSSVESLSKQANLHIDTVINIKGNPTTKSKRSMYKLSKQQIGLSKPTTIDELTIEIDRGNYTSEYKELCSDFYLKF